MAAIIRINNLKKVYPIGKEKVVALNNISLEIEEGQICCILGTSGSGKSTLLNQLAGLEKPSRGEVYIGKTNISKLSEGQLARFRQKNIGFVFQSYNLLPAYTALENVAMPLMFRGMGKRRRNKRAITILKSVGLDKRMKHKPTQMSGGQQQRVGIARAFVAKPKIVFADEPTGNLDTKTTRSIMEMMVNLCRKYKHTLVLVTHDRELALYSDRIITLIDGNIVNDKENVSIARTEEQIKADEEEQKAERQRQEQERKEQLEWETKGVQNEDPSLEKLPTSQQPAELISTQKVTPSDSTTLED